MNRSTMLAAGTLLFAILFIWDPVYSQTESAKVNQAYRVMCYNVENLFDTFDDSTTRDEEFTPEGERHWTNHKFYDKLNKVYKIIMAVGAWEPPAIIGFCEIENRYVLEKLIYDTPLSKFDYQIIHYESPDRRGIDVGMIYRRELFEPFHQQAIAVTFADDMSYKTRDILYVKGLIGDSKIIHLFINHWPSRYGGYLATVSRRRQAANVLKHCTDSILNVNPNAAIIIMGDFNDDPEDESISKVIGAKAPGDTILKNSYYNLSLSPQNNWNFGTLKYRESWNHFDQLMVSGNLLNYTKDLFIDKTGMQIFHADFLLEADEKYLGLKPYRTFTGFKYNGGYSDHLPIYFDLIIAR